MTRNAETPVDELRMPRLGRRGRWLWQQLVEDGAPSPAERVLIEEACRLADRLDRLDAISNGKDRAWIQIADDVAFAAGEIDGRIEIVVDKVLSEARQQQATLKQILAELRQSRAAVAGPAGAGRPAQRGVAGATAGGKSAGGVTDLAARIAAKRGAQTAG